MPLLEPHSTPSLDEWAPRPQARLRYARHAAVSPDELWAAALGVRLRDTPRMHRLIRWRLGSHAPPPDTTFHDFFRTGIFIQLEEGERHTVSGVAGKIWTPSGQYERFATAADYKEHATGGTAKVVILHAVREHPEGAELVSAAHVVVHGRRTRIFFRPFWQMIHPFARFIGSEALAAAVARAEWRAPRGGSRRGSRQP